MKMEVKIVGDGNKTICTDSVKIRVVSDVTGALMRIIDRAPDSVVDWKSVEIKVIRES